MKNKKIISTVLASMVVATAAGQSLPKVFAEELKTDIDLSISVNSNAVSNAAQLFAYKNPKKNIIINSLAIMYVNIDFLFTKTFVRYEHNGYQIFTLYDLDTDEPILKISDDLREEDFSKRIITDYGYFEEGTDIRSLDFAPISADIFGKYEKLVEQILSDGTLSLEQVAYLSLLYDSDINNWYVRNKIKKLETMEYKNTVPSKNDKDLIYDYEFRVCVQEDVSKDWERSNLSYFFLKTVKVTDSSWDFFDIFTGERFASKTNGKDWAYFETNGVIIKTYNALLMWENAISLQEPIAKFAQPFRKAIEIVNGKKYFNVGKLRLLYENIDSNHQVDYSTYMDKELPKPGSKNFKVNWEDYTLSTINKQKKKEINKKS